MENLFLRHTLNPLQIIGRKQLNSYKNVKETQFGCELCTEDEAGKMDYNDPSVAVPNCGLKERFEFTMSGNTVTLRGRLPIDFLRQERLLLNQSGHPHQIIIPE